MDVGFGGGKKGRGMGEWGGWDGVTTWLLGSDREWRVIRDEEKED
jgi:hypothetical protein